MYKLYLLVYVNIIYFNLRKWRNPYLAKPNSVGIMSVLTKRKVINIICFNFLVLPIVQCNQNFDVITCVFFRLFYKKKKSHLF